MSNGNGHSWSKFTWKDWMSEPTLRACGYAARGLWMDMLCLAHQGTPVGHITLNGKAPTLGQLAAMLGGKEREVGKLLAELEAAGVFSRTTEGVIYSRRMVKDARVSEQARAWGREGGNPVLNGKEQPSKNPAGGLTPPLSQPIRQGVNAPLIAKSSESEKESLSFLNLKGESLSAPAREDGPTAIAAAAAARLAFSEEIAQLPPELAATIKSLGRSMKHYAVEGFDIRKQSLEAAEQRDIAAGVVAHQAPRGKPLSPEHLAALRRAAGIGRPQLRIVA